MTILEFVAWGAILLGVAFCVFLVYSSDPDPWRIVCTRSGKLSVHTAGLLTDGEHAALNAAAAACRAGKDTRP